MAPLGEPGEGSADDAPSDAQIRTFLIADVRGYTLFTQERGDEAAGKLAAKFADIARETVEARGGRLLELRGDEALCVFASAREAIRAAVDLQQRFVDATLDEPELPLTVGIGLDAGEAVAVQGGYRGGALNLAARLCGQARAGEILASREVTHLARRIDGVRYQDRAAMTFKGLEDPVAVSRVVPEGADPVERLQPFVVPPRKPPPRSRRPRLVGALVLVVALAAVASRLVGTDGGAPLEIAANSVARLSGDGSLELKAALGQRPGASAIGFESLWVAHPDRGSVSRVALDDGSVTQVIRVGNSPAGVAVGEGSVWVTNAGDGTVSRINVDTNEVSQVLRVGTSPTGIAVGDGALWVADSIGAALLRVDPTSGEITSVPLAGRPVGIAFTPEAVWVSAASNTVARVDPAGPTVVFNQPVGSGPTSVLPAYGSVWVANHLDGTVTRLDPSTGRAEATIPVGQGANALVATGDSVWVANEFEDSVAMIDPATNDVERTIPVGGAAASLAGHDGSLWLAVGTSASEHRGGTLVVSSAARAPESLDPAVVYTDELLGILTITNDGLMAFKKVGGPDGATLVPDLASALPEVSPDGLTYRFPLRAGITYSTGEPIRPEDFRRAIERTLVLHEAAYLLSAIEDAETCTPDAPDRCDLSGSIEVGQEAVTFHLATPDPELPFKLAMPFAFPVPADTPAEDQGLQPLPATGPYVVTEAGLDGVELVRSEAFEEWSAAAQPDGFVDRMSWRFEEDVSAAFPRLQAGEVDVMIEAPAPGDLATLRSEHPDQIVALPGAFTLFVGFDVVKPPFDDERVRQAVNLAIDRERVVDILGGSTIQRPTCQILPPNFQGYAPFCPYTLDPASGVWSAPDVDRARDLIEEAGVAGTPVTVLTTDDTGGVPPGAAETMRYVTDVLGDLGLEPRLEVVHDADAYFPRIYLPNGAGTRRHPHVFLSGWIADFPAAQNFIDAQFACGDRGFGNPSGWCDEAMDARVDETQLLYATDPGAANRAWTEIEHDLVERAVQAPLTNPVTTHAVSDRVGNVQVNPQWGLMPSLMWVQ